MSNENVKNVNPAQALFAAAQLCGIQDVIVRGQHLPPNVLSLSPCFLLVLLLYLIILCHVFVIGSQRACICVYLVPLIRQNILNHHHHHSTLNKRNKPEKTTPYWLNTTHAHRKNPTYHRGDIQDLVTQMRHLEIQCQHLEIQYS